jgi:PAS domain S-box-containing protein
VSTPVLSGDVASAVLACLPEAFLVMDAAGQVQYLNPAAADLLGHAAEDLIGASVTRFIVAQPGQRIDPVAWLARWATEPGSPQLRYLTLSGRTGSGALLRLSVRVARLDADPARYVVVLRDVTAEQQQHVDAKHAYLLASRILAIAEDAIVNLDAEQRIDFFNRKAELLFGYRADEVLGQPVDMLLPARFRSGHGVHIDSFRRGKQPARMMGERGEILGLTKDGEEIPLEASITKVFIEGRPTFSAQLRDIRARKAAERKLRESEQRFRTVFDRAMEAIALLDSDGIVLELNEATATLLGNGVAAVGEAFWMLPWWPQASGASERSEAQRNLRETVARCRAGEEIRTRAELHDAAGGVHVLDFSLRPIVSDGRTVAMIAEGRDITRLVGDSSR